MDPDQLPLFDQPRQKRPRRRRHAAQAAPNPLGSAQPAQKTITVPGLDPFDGLVTRTIKGHSLEKGHCVRRYADTVTRAMRGKFSACWWVEGFAGPGRLFFEDEHQYLDGSPLDALNVKHPYDGYVFNDLGRANAAALAKRVGAHRGVHVRNLDANSRDFLRAATDLIPRHALVVLYLDPEGLELHFSTLAAFAESFDHLDFVINFPVRGLIRYQGAGHSKLAAKVLDLREVAERVGQGGAWSESARAVMNEYLDELGFQHRVPREIRTGRNAPLYDLLLASRHPKAKELFQKATAIEYSGQRQLGLM